MKDFRVGTCSWTDRSLLSSGWYPDRARDVPAKLRHYSGFFDTVEIDSTFYAIPDETDFFQWASRTPPGFLFNVKAFGLFTFHALPVSALPGSIRPKDAPRGSRIRIWEIPKENRVALWDVFISRVMVLHRMDRLGYLLFQFPPWVTFSEKNLNWFRRIGSLGAPLRIALEVRHGSWLEDGNRGPFLDMLRDQNMAYTAVDEPKLDWTVPPEWNITATWGTVLRFHGRNAPAWGRRNATVAERFNYLYDIDELRAFSGLAKKMADDIGRVFLMFNNCFRDNAVRNALQMRALLGFGSSLPPGQESLDLGEVPPAEPMEKG
ncbi:MAG: DUF72 domain-containing protein [Thermovirgaceae bacterium]|nr:DUF72 domain-containing protein [Thermovirgaceae bacterium]